MANLLKAVVLDRRTSKHSSADVGDIVMCCNCGRTMFVNIGTEVCPECDQLLGSRSQNLKMNMCV